MSDILHRIDRKIENDHQIRLMLSHDALIKRERHSALGRMFDYWRESHLNRTPKSEMHFDPGKVLSTEAVRWVSWIDTRATSALEFVWHNHPYRWLGDVSTDYCDASGTKVATHKVKSHRQYCAIEYQLCKTSKAPLYHEIEQHTGSIRRHYTRLLLPVIGPEEDVHRIFYVCRRFLSV